MYTYYNNRMHDRPYIQVGRKSVMAQNMFSFLIMLMSVVFFFITGSANAQTSLNRELTPFLTRYELPALAAAVVKDGKIIAVGAVGTRKAGEMIPVTINDRFHLGSDTKAMTALLAAIAVEEGHLRWNCTIADVFPELKKRMDPGLQRVSLTQLLSHTSGLPPDDEIFGNLLKESFVQNGNLDDLRYWLVEQWSTRPLQSTPGKNFTYANMNYVIAGAMIERVCGKTWDEMITERIFFTLGLTTAGLGPQSSLGRVDAPLGHKIVSDKITPYFAGPNGDNPLIMGPAGIAHMSILDFARWAGWNAGQGKRGPNLVTPETMKKLQAPIISMPEIKSAAPGTPSRGRYGLGWGEMAVDWASEPLLYHGGSNTKNLAHIWINTKTDFAMVTATNIGGSKANEALFSLAPVLYEKFADTQ